MNYVQEISSNINEGLVVKRVITFGTYDLFHFGHLRILQRAREMGEELIVGVSSDQLNFSKKQKYPIFSQEHRMAIVSEIKGVNTVFLEESLEKKAKQLSIAQKNLEVMKTQIAKQDGIIKDLGMVQANAQNLLQSLMKYGNKTENFDKILTEHVDNLGDTAKIMESLTIKMTNQHFAQMDADGDGKVDSEEFKQWLAGQPQ